MNAKQFYLFRCFLILILATLTQFTSAQSVIYVNYAADGANDGSSWASAFLNLQDALAAAETGDEIWVAQGIYYPAPDDAEPGQTWFLLDKDIRLFGGFTGTEKTSDARDGVAHPTILSGDLLGDDVPGDLAQHREDNALHVMYVAMEITSEAVIDGFVFRGGHADEGVEEENQPFRAMGGAVLSYGEPILRNCRFTDNYAEYGGALAFLGGIDTKIEKCSFRGNGASAGGAVYVVNAATLEFEQSVFRENAATLGGAIYNSTGITRLSNCLLAGNEASENGSAIYCAGYNPEMPGLQLAHTTIADNGAAVPAIFQFTASTENPVAVIQTGNSIFANAWNYGYPPDQNAPPLISLGGNISTDESLSGQLAADHDFHAMDPGLSGDYRPAEATSLCVDFGVSLEETLSFDIEGNSRPQGFGYDIGAFESAFFNTSISSAGAPQLDACLELSPNPVREILKVDIQTPQSQELWLETLDANGRILREVRVQSPGALFQDFQELPDGIYILRLTDGKKALTKKVLKQ